MSNDSLATSLRSIYMEQLVATAPGDRVAATTNTTAEASTTSNEEALRVIKALEQSVLTQQNSAVPDLTIVDNQQLENLAEAIRKTCRGIGTDEKGLFELLKTIPKDQLNDLNNIYQNKYGISLEKQLNKELSGAELEKGLSMLRLEGFDDASRIRVALMEHSQVFVGRSAATCERDLRDTLATMNSADIERLDKQYLARYGVNLHDALVNDPQLSSATKQSLEIYLKGADKRSTEDTLKLADIALGARNLDMFEETFRHASPEARRQFSDNNGKGRIDAAFGGLDRAKAWEYATRGDVGLATRVRDNTSWLGDNEEAIEKELEKLSDVERKSYMRGKELSELGQATNLSASDREALEYYNDVSGALRDAAGKWFSGESRKTELARWEDMIAVPGGTLISELSRHSGNIYDDGAGKIIDTIDNMSPADWQRLRNDPQFRRQVDNLLSDFLGGDDLYRVREAIEEKTRASTYEDAQKARRPVLDAIYDASGFTGLDLGKVADAVANMSAAEQRAYRDNARFREEIDFTIFRGMKPQDYEVVSRLLNQVRNGEQARIDIVTKLGVHASHFNTDEAAVIAELKRAFEADPDMRRRILEPKTPEEIEFSREFNHAIHRALDDGEYKTYAKPLIETGNLSIATEAKLFSGFFDDDEYAVYRLISTAKPEDWSNIINNPSGTLPFLSERERQVAVNIARQKGEMKPEDQLRAAMVGAGTDEEKIKEVLRPMGAEELQRVKEEYERKYGGNLAGDIFDELGGSDKTEMARYLREEPATSREAYNNMRDEVYESMDGIGRTWVRNFWDGTADVTNFEMNQMSAAITQWAREYQDMPLEERRFYETRAYEALDLYKKSEEAVADITVDAGIIAAGLLAAKFTGGVSLGLLTKTALLGAMFKVGTKSAIMGSDYDFQSAQTVVDGATGAVDALAVVIGPAQVAQVMGLGKGAAVQATERLFTEGAGNLLKEGVTKAQVGQRIFELVAKSLSQGSSSIDGKLVAQLAREIGKEGTEKVLTGMLARHMQVAVISQSTAFLQTTLREVALNSTAAAIGGGTSGTVRGLAHWDSSNSFEENLKTVAQSAALSAGMAAAMATTFTLTFKAIGKGIETVQEMTGRGRYLDPGTEALVNGQPLEQNTMVTVGRNDIAGATDAVSNKHLSIARDSRGNLLLMDHSDAGTWIKRAGSDEFEKISFASPVKIHPGDEIRLGSADGPPLKLSRVSTDDLNPFILKSNPNGEVTRLATSGGEVGFKKGRIDLNQDLEHTIADVRHEYASYDELIPGSEQRQYTDYADFRARAIKQVEKHSRVYKLTGFDTEIVVPEEYAAKLDELRELRQVANLDPRLNPGDERLIYEAQKKLLNHPLRNRLLPEQMGPLLAELPDRRFVTRLELLEGASPDDVWMSQVYEPNFVSAGNASIDEGTIRFFRGYDDVTEHVRQYLSHEWAHTVQSHPSFDAFKIAAEIEQSGWYVRKYATHSVDENWAVHLGEEFLNPDTARVEVLAKEAPLRAVAMAETMKRVLSDLPAELRSPEYLKQLEHLEIIGRDAIPQAKRILDGMLNSGDSAQINRALNFLQSLQRGQKDFAFGPSLMDYNTVLKIARESQDDALARSAVRTLIELYGKEPPDNVIEAIVDLSRGTGDRAAFAEAALTQIRSMPIQLERVRNASSASPILFSIDLFEDTADKMILLREGLDRLNPQERLRLVNALFDGQPPEWQIAMLDEISRRGDSAVLQAVKGHMIYMDPQVAQKFQQVADQLSKGTNSDVIGTLIATGEKAKTLEALELIDVLTLSNRNPDFTTNLIDKAQLMRLASSRDREIATAALNAIGRIYHNNPPEDVVDMLLRLAESRSVKAPAAKNALLAISSLRAHKRLLDLGKVDLTDSVAWLQDDAMKLQMIRYGLNTLDSATRLNQVEKMLTLFDDGLRAPIIEQLKQMADPSMIPALKKMIADYKASPELIARAREVLDYLERRLPQRLPRP